MTMCELEKVAISAALPLEAAHAHAHAHAVLSFNDGARSADTSMHYHTEIKQNWAMYG